MRQWNPRFLAYCKAHGRTPQQMLKERHIYEFPIWMNRQWQEFESHLIETEQIGPRWRNYTRYEYLRLYLGHDKCDIMFDAYLNGTREFRKMIAA